MPSSSAAQILNSAIDAVHTAPEPSPLFDIPLVEPNATKPFSELDAPFENRQLNVNLDLFDLRRGVRGSIRTNITAENVRQVLNDQLLEITPTIIKSIINTFPECDRDDARVVLEAASQFSTIKSLGCLLKHMAENGIQQYSWPGSATLADVLRYFSVYKAVVPLCDDPVEKDEESTAIILDEQMIEVLKGDVELAGAIARGEMPVIIPEGFSLGINPYTTPLPSEIYRRTAQILADAREIVQESGGVLPLGMAVRTVITQPLITQLEEVCTAQGREEKFAAQISIVGSGCGQSPKTDEALAATMNDKQGISAEQTEGLFHQALPEAYHAIAADLLVRTSTVYSSRSLALLSRKVHDKILEVAEQHSIAPHEIGYFVPGSNSSYVATALMHRLANGIPTTQFLSALVPEDGVRFGDFKAIVILDDLAGTGSTLKSCMRTLKDNYIPELTILAPLIATSKAMSKSSHFGLAMRQAPNVTIVPGAVVPGLFESEFYVSLSSQQRELVKRVVGDPGYHSSGLALSFPYMSPDNNHALYVKCGADYFTLEKGAINPACWNRPDDKQEQSAALEQIEAKRKLLTTPSVELTTVESLYSLVLKLKDFREATAIATTLGVDLKDDAPKVDAEVSRIISTSFISLADELSEQARAPAATTENLIGLGKLYKSIQDLRPGSDLDRNFDRRIDGNLAFVRSRIIDRVRSTIEAAIKEPFGNYAEIEKRLGRIVEETETITAIQNSGVLGSKGRQLSTMMLKAADSLNQMVRCGLADQLSSRQEQRWDVRAIKAALPKLKEFYGRGTYDGNAPKAIESIEELLTDATNLHQIMRRSNELRQSRDGCEGLRLVEDASRALLSTKGFGYGVEQLAAGVLQDCGTLIRGEIDQIKDFFEITTVQNLINVIEFGRAMEKAAKEFGKAERLTNRDFPHRKIVELASVALGDRRTSLRTDLEQVRSAKSIESIAFVQAEVRRFTEAHNATGGHLRTELVALVRETQAATLQGLASVLAEMRLRNRGDGPTHSVHTCFSEFTRLDQHLPERHRRRRIDILEVAFINAKTLMVSENSFNNSTCCSAMLGAFDVLLVAREALESSKEAARLLIDSRKIVCRAHDTLCATIESAVDWLNSSPSAAHALKPEEKNIKLELAQDLQTARNHKCLPNYLRRKISAVLNSFDALA